MVLFSVKEILFAFGVFLALEVLELLSCVMYFCFLISKYYFSNIISKLTLGCLQRSFPFPPHPNRTPLVQRLRLHSWSSFYLLRKGGGEHTVVTSGALNVWFALMQADKVVYKMTVICTGHVCWRQVSISCMRRVNNLLRKKIGGKALFSGGFPAVCNSWLLPIPRDK